MSFIISTFKPCLPSRMLCPKPTFTKSYPTPRVRASLQDSKPPSTSQQQQQQLNLSVLRFTLGISLFVCVCVCVFMHLWDCFSLLCVLGFQGYLAWMNPICPDGLVMALVPFSSWITLLAQIQPLLHQPSLSEQIKIHFYHILHFNSVKSFSFFGGVWNGLHLLCFLCFVDYRGFGSVFGFLLCCSTLPW